MSEATRDALLPPNQTELEGATGQAMQASVSPAVLRTLWNPWTCPAHLLPWLAWALSVDEWDDSWQEHTRRQVIAQSLDVHRAKGSVASVRRALAAAGYPYAVLDEVRNGCLHDGSAIRDGWHLRGGSTPHVYRVRLNGLITVGQAAQIRRILATTAPARSHLHSLDFRGAVFLHNKFAVRDGSYIRGVVNG